MLENDHQDAPVSSPQSEYDALRAVSPESPCPYLPGRLARHEAYLADPLSGAEYEMLLAQGFRRCGRVVYRPRCRGCNECRQIRIPTNEFSPSRSMRRLLKRNEDVRVDIVQPTPTEEGFELFRRYLDAQHDRTMARGFDAFVGFLYDSPLETYEYQYRLGGKLIGASLIDRCPTGLSSVYMYFDPDHARRGLGIFSILWEIAHCRSEGLPYYYLGFYVAQCAKMSYKARFRPCQVLVANGRWLTLREKTIA